MTRLPFLDVFRNDQAASGGAAQDARAGNLVDIDRPAIRPDPNLVVASGETARRFGIPQINLLTETACARACEGRAKRRRSGGFESRSGHDADADRLYVLVEGAY